MQSFNIWDGLYLQECDTHRLDEPDFNITVYITYYY